MNRFFVFLAVVIMATQIIAGTLTETRSQMGAVEKITFAWSTPTNAASGVSGTSPFIGRLDRVVIAKTTATTGAVYSVTINDTYGNDLLNGLCTASATGTVQSFCPGVSAYGVGSTSAIPRTVYDTVSIVVTNCGASASGSFVMYFTR